MDKISYQVLNNEKTPITIIKGENSTPVWIQQRWTDGEYSSYIRQNGCGHCCVAMSLRLKGDKSITPYSEYLTCREIFGEPTIVNGVQQYHFLSFSAIVKVLKHFNVNATSYNINSGSENEGLNLIISALKQNKLVIFCSAPKTKDNPFSTGWHYVLFVGMQDDKIVVANSSLNGIFDKVQGIQYVDAIHIKNAMVTDVEYNDNTTWGVLPETMLGASFVIVD